MQDVDLATAYAARHVAGAVAHIAWAGAVSVALVIGGRVALAWLGWRAGRRDAARELYVSPRGRILARGEIPVVEL